MVKCWEESHFYFDSYCLFPLRLWILVLHSHKYNSLALFNKRWRFFIVSSLQHLWSLIFYFVKLVEYQIILSCKQGIYTFFTKTDVCYHLEFSGHFFLSFCLSNLKAIWTTYLISPVEWFSGLGCIWWINFQGVINVHTELCAAWFIVETNVWECPTSDSLGKGSIFMCYIVAFQCFHDKFVYQSKLFTCLFPRAFDDVSRYVHSSSLGQGCLELNSLHIPLGIYRYMTVPWWWWYIYSFTM